MIGADLQIVYPTAGRTSAIWPVAPHLRPTPRAELARIAAGLTEKLTVGTIGFDLDLISIEAAKRREVAGET